MTHTLLPLALPPCDLWSARVEVGGGVVLLHCLGDVATCRRPGALLLSRPTLFRVTGLLAGPRDTAASQRLPKSLRIQ